jgi:hypothetical protein
LWELATCVEGYNLAHGGEPELQPPTAEEFEALIANSPTLQKQRMN